MKTECNPSAGSARPEMTQLQAIDQIDCALERLTALLALLCHDCSDGKPFTGGDDNAEIAFALASSLLSRAWEARQVLMLDTEESLHFTDQLEQLTVLVTLLHANLNEASTGYVFVALGHALDLTEATACAAEAAWRARRHD